MSEEIKFTDEEMKIIQDIQKEYFDTQNLFGQISVARLRLEEQANTLDKEEDELRTKFKDNQTKEQNFLDEINKKYGQGSLNPDTGISTPNKSE